MRKNLQDAAFDQIISDLYARDIPAEDRNEVLIFFVKVALGGVRALDGVEGLTSQRLGLSHASRLAEAAVSISNVMGLEQVERIILHLGGRTSRGRTDR
jgi:hypothetical protein